ncbi:50s ribosomal protein [Paraphysoderma sedebokerense]|nr:50s ribosomal protein [Paraphysoderma sedebokerense]
MISPSAYRCILRDRQMLRKFSSTSISSSHIGKATIRVDPKQVTVAWTHQYPSVPPNSNPPSKHAIDSREPYTVTVKGPKTTLNLTVPPFVHLDLTPNPKTNASDLLVSVDYPSLPKQKSMWGTTRALLSNMVKGVVEGFTVNLRLVGVGYRAAVDTKENTVQLKLGFANTIKLKIPEHVEVKVPQPDMIVLNGPDKNVVTQFAASIRALRKPEPYNQKGIFVNDETIAKKKGKKR